jgi:outer membrane protein TolC
MQEEYAAATKLATIVQQRLDAGQDTRTELLKARRTAAQIQLVQLRTEDEIATVNDHLTRLIGLQGTTFATVPNSIPDMTLKDDGTLAQVMSPGVRSAYAAAKSKQQTAFGDARYRFRPQVSFGLNFSYIDTSHTNYLDYYPGFKDKSRDAASVGIQMSIPLYDRSHEAKAHEAAADAAHAFAEADNLRNQFLEGRFKLSRSAKELNARSAVSELDFELAQEQLKTVQIQLNAASGDPNAAQLTPKDEQNARLQERQRYVDLLDAQLELAKAQLQLMRQNGTLDDWLKQASTTLTKP